MNPHFLVLAGLGVGLTVYRAWLILHLGIDPYVDEVYYWGWAQDLDWGYFSKPPLIAGLIALSTGLFGDNLLALKLPSLLLYPATALLVQGIGTRLFGPRVGFWSGLAYLALPQAAALALFISTDAPLMFCWALALWLLLVAVDGGARWAWIALGLAVGTGLMAKYTMLAFVGSAFLALLALPRGRAALRTPGPWIALLVAGAVFAPNLWWNWQHDFPTFRHTAEITRLEQRSWSPDEFFEFLGGQWASMGLLLAPVLVWAAFAWRRLWPRHEFRWLLVFSLPLLILVALQALTGRANSNWAGPAYVAATVLAVAFLADRRRWRLLGIAVALNVLTAALAYHWPDIARVAGVELTGRNDPYKRARGWAEVAAEVRPHLEAHPQAILVAEDRDVLAELNYFLRPARYASWNPNGTLNDHYQLTTALAPDPAAEVLFVTKRADIGPVQSRFAAGEQVGQVNVEVHRDYQRRFGIYLLRGFHGYPPRMPPGDGKTPAGAPDAQRQDPA